MRLPGDLFPVRLRYKAPRGGKRGAMVADVYDREDRILGCFASVAKENGKSGWREWIQYPEGGEIPEEAFTL